MKDKIFSVLQRVGRSFMLPIAILPVAGLLLGIGSSFTNATTIETYHLTSILGEGTVLNALLMIMNKVGSAVFDNLPLIFAVGVAIGMAKKEKEVSALSAVIAYFVMNTAINAMLTITGQILDNGEIAESVLDRPENSETFGVAAAPCGGSTIPSASRTAAPSWRIRSATARATTSGWATKRSPPTGSESAQPLTMR